MNMKINKQLIAELSALPDDKLWEKICDMAAGYGYTLPREKPRDKDMAMLRAMMKDAEKIGPADLVRLLATFKAKRR